MPAIPNSTESVRDYGLGSNPPASMMPLYMGVSSGGVANSLVIYGSPTALRAAEGEGPAVEAAANSGGWPIGFMRLTASISATNGQCLPTYGVTGTNGSITKSGAGPTITVAGAPNGHYLMRIEITTGGALGTAILRWSIDNGSTWEASSVATTGGTVVLSSATLVTGITATLPAGTYVLNETYSWTATPGGGQIAVSGSATLDSHVLIEIMTSGALGVGRFRYSLDGYSGDTAEERTYSETITIPSGGTFAVPGLGITLTFDDSPTAFVAGDSYACDVECAAANATNLASGVTAVLASSTKWRFCYFVTSKGNGNATAHALLAAALQSHLDTLAGVSKYRRGMIAATHEDTAAASVAAFLNTTAIRLLIAHGQVRRASKKPFSGHAFPVTNAADVICGRAAASLPSTDLKRVRSGSCAEVVKLFHDERQSSSQCDDVKISTMRTYENFAGYYITQARLKSPEGSDFTHWPRGIVMDIACETVNRMLTQEIGKGVRYITNVINDVEYPGVIDPRDRIVIEDSVNDALAAALSTPLNAEGTEGHVTQVRFSISETHNLLSTGVLMGEVGIEGLAYIDNASTTVGFVVALPEAA